MAEPFKLKRIPTLKTPGAFREHIASLGLDLPCDDAILPRAESPLAKPLDRITLGGKTPGNRIAIHPMEGWDGTPDGRATDLTLRRWTNFGRSGASLAILVSGALGELWFMTSIQS